MTNPTAPAASEDARLAEIREYAARESVDWEREAVRLLLRLLDARPSGESFVTRAMYDAAIAERDKAFEGWNDANRQYGEASEGFDRLSAALSAAEGRNIVLQRSEARLREALRVFVEATGAYDDDVWIKQLRREASAALRPAAAAEETTPAADPREPDPKRSGFWALHNCAGCEDGRYPCIKGGHNQCYGPRARNG